MVTGLYAAILATIQVIITMNIVRLRRSNKVAFGDGGHDELTRKIRGHGNFIETVPMALILMMIAELSGAPFWTIFVLGGLLLAGRLMHYPGLVSGKGYGTLRFYGMMLTLIVMLLGALLCFWLAIPVLLPGPLS